MRSFGGEEEVNLIGRLSQVIQDRDYNRASKSNFAIIEEL